MQVALYARVSTKDKDQDPEVQLVKLRDFAARHGWETHNEYIDFATGRDGNRPGLKKLLQDARAGKFETVVIVRIDRIMRSLAHFLNLVEALERQGIRLESSSDGLDYSTPTGRLMRNILASVAEFEGQLIVERTKEGLAKAAKDGHYPGRPRKEVNLDLFLELMKQPGMTKAKACKKLRYTQGTVNNRLKAAGLFDYIGAPTTARRPED